MYRPGIVETTADQETPRDPFGRVGEVRGDWDSAQLFVERFSARVENPCHGSGRGKGNWERGATRRGTVLCTGWKPVSRGKWVNICRWMTLYSCGSSGGGGRRCGGDKMPCASFSPLASNV